MLVGVFPAFKDGGGAWRFVLMTTDGNGDRGRIVFGTEQNEDGMLESKFRTVLRDGFKLSPSDVDLAVKLAKGEVPAVAVA